MSDQNFESRNMIVPVTTASGTIWAMKSTWAYALHVGGRPCSQLQTAGTAFLAFVTCQLCSLCCSTFTRRLLMKFTLGLCGAGLIDKSVAAGSLWAAGSCVCPASCEDMLPAPFAGAIVTNPT